jgi:hypothetical protein
LHWRTWQHPEKTEAKESFSFHYTRRPAGRFQSATRSGGFQPPWRIEGATNGDWKPPNSHDFKSIVAAIESFALRR